jgi:hypothetical protein
VRTASPEVHSADGRHRATAEVHFVAGFSGAHSSRSDEVSYVLRVDGRAVVFRHAFVGEGLDLRTARKVVFEVRFAADGRTVSVSDGGPFTRHVVLEPGEPFHCSGAGAPRSPGPRALVQESLAALTAPREQRTCDLAGLTRFLCASGDDGALWLDALGPLLSSSLVDEERAPLVRCLGRAITAHGPVREQVLAALVEPRTQAVAAEALGSQADPSVELALAAALRATDETPESAERCERAAKLSWALASSVVARHAAVDSTRALLQHDLLAAPACPKALTGKARRVYALAALAALDAPAVKTLAASCAGSAVGTPVTFKQWNDAMLDGLTGAPLECLAKGWH